MQARFSIYARVSSPAQVGKVEDPKVSIPLQLQACRLEAEKLGLIPAEVSTYVEPGLGGEMFEERPALQALLTDAKAAKFDVLLVQMMDRLGRESWMSQYIYTILLKEGIQLISLDLARVPLMDPKAFKEQSKRNPDRLIEIAIKGVLSQLDQAQRVQRFTAAKKEIIRREGKWLYSQPPYGYKFEFINNGDKNGEKPLKTLVPDPATYHLLEELPDLILKEHLGDVAIARLFNDRGITRPTGSKWWGASIRDLRTNVFYAGYTPWAQRGNKGKAATSATQGPHSYPHPWTMETFEAMRSAKAARFQWGARAAGPSSPFAPVLKCGYCKGPMTIQLGRRLAKYPNSFRYDYLRCTTHKYSGECRANGWGAWGVWQAIAAYIEELVADSLQAPDSPLAPPQALIKSSGEDSRLKGLEKERVEIESQIEKGLVQRRRRINLAYQTAPEGVISLEDYYKQLADLAGDEEKLKQQLAEIDRRIASHQDRAANQRRFAEALSSWQELRGKAIAAGPIRKWPPELIQQIKYDVIQPLFSAIYIKEAEGGERTGKRKQKNIQIWFDRKED